MEEEGDEFGFVEGVEVDAFVGEGHGWWGGDFAGEVAGFLAGGVAVGADPFFLFKLDHRGGDGAVVAVLVPGGVAAVAEDDLVRGWGVSAAAVYADGGFARFAAFGFGFFGGGGRGGGSWNVRGGFLGGECGVVVVDYDGGECFGLGDAAAGGCVCEEIEFFGDVCVVFLILVVVASLSLPFDRMS